jgi:hypothetical protein
MVPDKLSVARDNRGGGTAGLGRFPERGLADGREGGRLHSGRKEARVPVEDRITGPLRVTPDEDVREVSSQISGGAQYSSKRAGASSTAELGIARDVIDCLTMTRSARGYPSHQAVPIRAGGRDGRRHSGRRTK